MKPDLKYLGLGKKNDDLTFGYLIKGLSALAFILFVGFGSFWVRRVLNG